MSASTRLLSENPHRAYTPYVLQEQEQELADYGGAQMQQVVPASAQLPRQFKSPESSSGSSSELDEQLGQRQVMAPLFPFVSGQPYEHSPPRVKMFEKTPLNHHLSPTLPGFEPVASSKTSGNVCVSVRLFVYMKMQDNYRFRF